MKMVEPRRAIWLLLAGLAWPAVAPAEEKASDPDPRALLEDVRRFYRTAPSYVAEGKAMTKVIQPREGVETSIGGTFKILLARPDFYRVEWTLHLDLGKTSQGVVWNDGEGARLYLSDAHAVTPMPSDRAAMSAATGPSMGTSHTIPTLFFGLDEGPSLLERLEEVRLEGEETVGGTRCRILSGSLPSGVDYRLWIGIDQPYLVQIENTLGGTSSQTAIPESTPEQMAKALEAMGMEDTPENRAHIHELLDKARAVMSNVRGTARQIHTGIDMMRPLAAEEFAFEVPEGTVEKASLMEATEAAP